MLTEDHTRVQELVRVGAISEEQARTHPERNVIIRALGTREDVAVDRTIVGLEPGDRLLLCRTG